MNVFVRFAHYVKPYWLHIVAVLACTGLFVLFSSSAYWLAASFLQALFTGSFAPADQPPPLADLNAWLTYWTHVLLAGADRHETLVRAAVAIVAAFFLKNLFSYLQLYYVSFIEQKVIKDLRDDLFDRFLQQDLGFFQQRRRGDLISTLLNDVEDLNQALNKSFTKSIRDPFNAAVLLTLLLIVSPKLTLAALIVGPVVGWTVLVLGRGIKKHAVRVQDAISRVTSHLQETLGGIRVVKAFTGEAFENRRFQAITTSHYRSALGREKLKRLVIPLNEVVGVLIISGLLYVGGELVLVERSMDSENFIRFLVLLFALLNPVLSLSNLVANIRHAEASGTRVFRAIDEPIRLLQPSRAPVPDPITRSLEADRVTFRYADDLPAVVENISFRVEPGQRLAIVGASGSGKSTLLNLLPRFYDVSSGAIRVDGVDIRKLDLAGLRRLFGIVTQQVILFHDTIFANIAYGDPGASEDDVIRAAQAAFADDFIRELPEGYATVVGEQGSLLSGGQRQRISIARALLKRPEIILLDEAASALDPEAAAQVEAALERLTAGRTVITVTHRVHTVEHADRILVLEQGRVVGDGCHGDLIETCEVYRTLSLKHTVA